VAPDIDRQEVDGGAGGSVRGQDNRARLAEEGITTEALATEPEDKYRLTGPSREALRTLARRAGRSGALSPLGYNLTISHKHQFVWFRVAKVGTRSILGHFAQNSVEVEVNHAMRMRYPTALFADYFKFAFVRHPLTRFVSAWRNKVVDTNYFGFDDPTLARMQRIEEFARWVCDQDLADLATADHHLALQTRLVDLSQVDFLGRLETFDADFAAVCERIGVPVTEVDRRNQSTPRAGESDPSPELRDLLADVYRRDYQVFGYQP
jgi:hypothetical protein